MRMYLCADVRELLKCGEMLRILSANVMGKMLMWQIGNADMPIYNGSLDKKDNTGVNTVLNTGVNTGDNT